MKTIEELFEIIRDIERYRLNNQWFGIEAMQRAIAAAIHAAVYPEVCQCGPDREEYVEQTEGFLARTGCLRCDKWDEPERLKRP